MLRLFRDLNDMCNVTYWHLSHSGHQLPVKLSCCIRATNQALDMPVALSLLFGFLPGQFSVWNPKRQFLLGSAMGLLVDKSG